MEGHVDILSVVAVAQAYSGGLGDGTEPVGMLDTASGRPGEALFVGEYGGGKCATIVAAPTHQHHAQTGHFQISLNFELVCARTYLNKIHLCRK